MPTPSSGAIGSDQVYSALVADRAGRGNYNGSPIPNSWSVAYQTSLYVAYYSRSGGFNPFLVAPEQSGNIGSVISLAFEKSQR